MTTGSSSPSTAHAARDSYLTDPRHRVVADEIGHNAQRIVVFDI